MQNVCVNKNYCLAHTVYNMNQLNPEFVLFIYVLNLITEWIKYKNPLEYAISPNSSIFVENVKSWLQSH